MVLVYGKPYGNHNGSVRFQGKVREKQNFLKVREFKKIYKVILAI